CCERTPPRATRRRAGRPPVHPRGITIRAHGGAGPGCVRLAAGGGAGVRPHDDLGHLQDPDQVRARDPGLFDGFGGVGDGRESQPGAFWRFDVAALPVLPAAVVIWLTVRALARLDEVQKRTQMQAVGFSIVATALLTFGYGC